MNYAELVEATPEIKGVKVKIRLTSNGQKNNSKELIMLPHVWWMSQ